MRWLVAAEIRRARCCGDAPTWREARDRVDAYLELARTLCLPFALIFICVSILIVNPQ